MASTPSVLLVVKPTFAPAEPSLVGATGLKPTYRWPPTVVVRLPDSALACPCPSRPAVTLSLPVFTAAGPEKPS